MDTESTPTPWTAGLIYECNNGGRNLCCTDPAMTWQIGQIDDGRYSPELIARANAAGALLEALKACEARLTACARAFYGTGNAESVRQAFHGWKDDIEPARALIAKCEA